MNTYKLAKNYIFKRKYKVVEDAEDHITFRYQFENIHICEDQQNDGFLMMVLPISNNVTDENRYEVLNSCNDVNAELKHVKVYVINNLVLIASEIFYLSRKDMEHKMGIGLSSMVAAKARYEKKYLT